jgi:hypothetical protein
MRGVHDDVGFGGLTGQEVGAVEVAVDELDLGIPRGDHRAFVAVTR